jgi:hypothetical protein
VRSDAVAVKPWRDFLGILVLSGTLSRRCQTRRFVPGSQSQAGSSLGEAGQVANRMAGDPCNTPGCLTTQRGAAGPRRVPASMKEPARCQVSLQPERAGGASSSASRSPGLISWRDDPISAGRARKPAKATISSAVSMPASCRRFMHPQKRTGSGAGTSRQGKSQGRGEIAATPQLLRLAVAADQRKRGQE